MPSFAIRSSTVRGGATLRSLVFVAFVTPPTTTPTGIMTTAAAVYYWRARAITPAGTTSAWTAPEWFTTNSAPNAPTLTGPSGSTTLLTAALSWTFTDPDAGDTQSGWAVRTKIGAVAGGSGTPFTVRSSTVRGVDSVRGASSIGGTGIYRYWNASTGAWQAVEIVNPGSVLALNIVTSVGVWSWSARVADAAGVLSPYATDNVWTVTTAAVPGPPTSVTATAFNASALVAWVAPVSTGGSPIIDYTATSSPGGFTGTVAAPGTSVNVSGLSNGTGYTFTVTARNLAGSSVASSASSSVTPVAVTLPVMPRVTVEIAFATNAATQISDQVWTDVTHYVTGQIHTTTGREHESSQVVPGTMSLRLVNTDGRFNPFNTSSPHYGPFTDGSDTAVLGLVPMKRIRVRAVWNGVTYPVWSGFVDAWPMTWPNETLAYCDLSCTDAFEVLNLVSTSDVYALTVRSLSPTGWWRLGDLPLGTAAAGHVITAVAAESSGSGLNGVYSGASLGNPSLTAAHATGGSMETDNGSAQNMTVAGSAYTTPVLGLGAGYRSAVWSGGSFSWSCLLQRGRVQSTGNGCGIVNMTYLTPAGYTGLNVALFGTNGTIPGGIFATLTDATTNVLAGLVQSTVRVDDSVVHHIAFTYNSAGPTFSLYLDGVLNQSSPAPSNLHVGANWKFPMVVGFGFGGSMQEVTMWDGTVLTAANITTLAQTALTAWNADITSDRVTRLIAAVGWSSADQVIEAGQSVMQAATSATSVLAALQTAADTERGLFFADPAGALRFYSRTHNLLNATASASQLTLGEGAEPYNLDGTLVSLDALDLWNAVEVTRNGGVTQRSVDNTSQRRYGPRTLTLTGDWQYDGDALSISQYLLDRFKDPTTRVNAIVVHPMSDPAILFPKALGLGLADRVTVTRNAPGVGVNYSQTANIEWIEHTIDVKADWHTVWKLSPADSRQYAILDDPVTGVLDSAACRLLP